MPPEKRSMKNGSTGSKTVTSAGLSRLLCDPPHGGSNSFVRRSFLCSVTPLRSWPRPDNECVLLTPEVSQQIVLRVEYLRSSIVPMLCDPAGVMAQAQQRMRASDPSRVMAQARQRMRASDPRGVTEHRSHNASADLDPPYGGSQSSCCSIYCQKKMR